MTSRFIEIGRIGRARGLDGWVRFLPEKPSIMTDFFTDSPIVYIKNERSGFQPLRIEDHYTEEKRNQISFFVKFDMITNRTEAEALKDKGLFSDSFDREAEEKSYETEPDDDLAGYEILYDSEPAGHVLDLFDNPAHSIIEVKTNSGVLLIPFVDEYILEVNHDKRIIYCQNLDQLIED